MPIQVKIKFNSGKRKVDNILSKSFKASIFTFLAEMKKKQYIPKDTGFLENNTRIASIGSDKAEISSKAEYVDIYLDRNINFKTVKSKNAQAFWFTPFITGKQKNLFSNIFKKNTKI